MVTPDRHGAGPDRYPERMARAAHAAAEDETCMSGKDSASRERKIDQLVRPPQPSHIALPEAVLRAPLRRYPTPS